MHITCCGVCDWRKTHTLESFWVPIQYKRIRTIFQYSTVLKLRFCGIKYQFVLFSCY